MDIYLLVVGVAGTMIAVVGLIRNSSHLAVAGAVTAVAFTPPGSAFLVGAGLHAAKTAADIYIYAGCLLGVFIGGLTFTAAISVFILTILVFKKGGEN